MPIPLFFLLCAKYCERLLATAAKIDFYRKRDNTGVLRAKKMTMHNHIDLTKACSSRLLLHAQAYDDQHGNTNSNIIPTQGYLRDIDDRLLGQKQAQQTYTITNAWPEQSYTSKSLPLRIFSLILFDRKTICWVRDMGNHYLFCI